VGSVLLALHAGVDKGTLNGLMAAYTLARAAYSVCYVVIVREKASFLRSAFWWGGNTSCIAMCVLAGKRL